MCLMDHSGLQRDSGLKFCRKVKKIVLKIPVAGSSLQVQRGDGCIDEWIPHEVEVISHSRQGKLFGD